MTRLEEAGRAYVVARRALAWQRDVLRREVRVALDAGMSESEVARVAGVTRMTIRAWRNHSGVSSGQNAARGSGG